ncbi:DNA polymerase III subunit beta [Candidatus Woesebacteria bacterium RIFCSPHIGHO2_01_FULL_39_17]|nr:MAG: DNA polymerase III subunit beta [Candidatus Woesebacteria bacterium RIFCSPHIGHO2_01_FULL_39_17]
MKIQVLQENLAKAISTCSRFASSRVQLPVLANILLKITKSKFSVAATNLEMSISISIGAKIEKEGQITVPARVLNDLISNLSAGTVDLEVEKENLKIKSLSFESSLSGMNASDFPLIPEEVGVDVLKIPSKEILDALICTLFAVSSDETRPVLTGVLMIVKDSNLTMVATDGFRLSQKKISIGKVKEEKKIILPKSSLVELSRLTSDEDIQFSFKKSEKQVVFGLTDIVLGSRIIEGEFPDFERIIPKETKIKVNLDREEFLRGVKLASVFARDAANVVKLTVVKDFLVVSAEGTQGSQKTKVEAKIDENGKTDSEEFVIAFNYRFLEEFLNAIKGDEVQIEFSDPNAPALFLDPKDTNFLHIIMPVRLQA